MIQWRVFKSSVEILPVVLLHLYYILIVFVYLNEERILNLVQLQSLNLAYTKSIFLPLRIAIKINICFSLIEVLGNFIELV